MLSRVTAVHVAAVLGALIALSGYAWAVAGDSSVLGVGVFLVFYAVVLPGGYALLEASEGYAESRP